jgi:mRNA-degrading endonuclease toxin of MazEF toxin-antitoxin module
VTQVATIDRNTLEDRIGLLPDWLLGQVDAGLQRALGLARR